MPIGIWPVISADERELVIAFLTRYVVWCGKGRHFDRRAMRWIC